MENLINLEYHGNPVRCIQKDGAPWWVLSDVCKVVGLGTPAKVANRLDEDEKGVNQIHTIKGNQKMTIINESGLYNVLLRSDKPEAKPFKRWVTHEVLPQIRSTGKYESQPEQLSLPLESGQPVVDIVTLANVSNMIRNNIRAYVRSNPDIFHEGEDYAVLRGNELAMYELKHAHSRRCSAAALTVFTRSGVEKLSDGYLDLSAQEKAMLIQDFDGAPAKPAPEPLPFDEMMRLRYNRITQAQMLLHIADRTPDAHQCEYLYEVVTDILMEEDV